MNRKGISPLIAAVLLIAFTMAVASIFAQWAPQLIQDAQGDTSDQAENIQRCSGNVIEVTSFDQSNNEATIQQTSGESGVGNLTVTWYYSSGNPAQNSSSDESSFDALGGPRDIVTVNDGSDGTSEVTEITVDPIDCQGAPTTSYEP